MLSLVEIDAYVAHIERGLDAVPNGGGPGSAAASAGGRYEAAAAAGVAGVGGRHEAAAAGRDEPGRPDAAEPVKGREAGTAPAGSSPLADLAWRFGALREQYRRKPESMAGAVPALARARARFDAAVANRIAEVVDRFNAVNAQLHRLELEREAWRDALIRAAAQSRRRELPGRTAVIAVKPTRGLAMPAAHTPQRALLDQAIRDGGCWEQVSYVARARLQQALDAGKLPPDVAATVQRLCPMTTSYAVICRPAR